MFLTKYRPTNPDLFDEFVKRFWNEDDVEAVWRPLTDISESDDAFTLHVELPGMSKEDVKLNVENNQLVISGERSEMSEEKKQNMHRIERHYGKFQRQFQLPQNVDASAINATFTNGILDVVIPKREDMRPREIEISVN